MPWYITYRRATNANFLRLPVILGISERALDIRISNHHRGVHFKYWGAKKCIHMTCIHLLLPVYIEYYNLIGFFFPFLKCVHIFFGTLHIYDVYCPLYINKSGEKTRNSPESELEDLGSFVNQALSQL
ncbi:hypothetical protein mRhiFer1_009303 [Rhinolophus ferrumequinum]|uniref:Uncharacterized protein n=1 Tax=Rhinolophus ferrumequinum TaxID=59479 RepID=A0A7J7RY41_RHIFE|nr:hypothetical protein mRhiFer1_009303 [Rhinolophus ferrumequinum]